MLLGDWGYWKDWDTGGTGVYQGTWDYWGAWQLLEELRWGLGAWRRGHRFRLGITGEPGGQIALGGYWEDWNSLGAGMETGCTWVVLGYWED